MTFGAMQVSFSFINYIIDIHTGANGSIDGQGEVWWKRYRSNDLSETRPYMIELMFSNKVQISDITLLNSPNWNVHPVYCR